MTEATATAPLVDAGALPELAECAALANLCASGAARVHAGGLWGGSQALVLAHLLSRGHLGERSVLVVLASDGEAEAFAGDLAHFGVESLAFPSREGADGGATMARMELARRMAGPLDERPQVVVASMVALLQPLPALKDLEREILVLKKGQVLDGEGLLDRLVRMGYERQPLAEAPGEVSLRGDILDLFPFAAAEPLRIELFEDEVESLRTFDPSDQRSTATHDELSVCLATDNVEVGETGATEPGALFPEDTLWVTVEPLRVEERTEALSARS